MAWTTPGTATAGEVLTAAFWNTNVRDNADALYQSAKRLGFVQSTSSYSVNQTTVAGASNVFSSSITFTAAGSTAYRVEFFCGGILTAVASNSAVIVHLVDGSGNAITRLCVAGSGNGTNAANYAASPVYFYTPSAGSITLNIRATYSAGVGTLNAGNATNDYPPMWFAVYGPDIT
jgi:hypothetical protein